MLLVKNFQDEVFMKDGNTVFRFNGTPIETKSTDWEQVGETPCLFDWQRDPGMYGPHYAVAELYKYTGQKECHTFTAGGSIVHIRNWARDHGYEFSPNIRLYSDRNTARSRAQVQW